MPDTDVLTPDKVISSRRSLPIGQCPKGLDQTLPGALHPRVVQRLQIKEQVEPSEMSGPVSMLIDDLDHLMGGPVDVGAGPRPATVAMTLTELTLDRA